ncbi:MAG: SPOR domain-containing protein [Chitinophagales bacterium]|nr:SPOR domain-containing protein [Chitinophagales bacterium]
MKNYVLTAIMICLSFLLFAQEERGLKVIQDEKIDHLMRTYQKKNLSKETEDGYRIQVLLSNTRDEVNKAKTKFYGSYPDLKCYIVYDQPYYKLRVGDFKSRIEAKRMLLSIANNYPTAFIVNDEINVRN